MKTLLVVLVILMGMGGQAFSMGHPHNVFAARKQMRAKASASVSRHRIRTTTQSCWQFAPTFNKEEFSKRVLGALAKAY